MPKRKSYPIHAAAIAAMGNDEKSDSLPNNFAGGVSLLVNAGTDQKTEQSGMAKEEEKKEVLAKIPTAVEWHQANVQSATPIMLPGANLLQETRNRQADMRQLQVMAEALPDANRRFSSSAIEQWKGLTPPTEDIIVRAVQLGLPRKTALRLTGYTLKNLKLWLRLGASGFSPYQNFRLRLLQAEAIAEAQSLGRVEEAAAIESKSATIYLNLLNRRFKVDEDDDEEEVIEDLPYEQFSVEELDSYLSSGGKVVPERFVTKEWVDGTTDDTESLRLELAKLKEENRLLSMKLETI